MRGVEPPQDRPHDRPKYWPQVSLISFQNAILGLNRRAKRSAKNECGKRFEDRGPLKPEADRLLQEALLRGEFERGEIERITGLPERSARRVLNDVIGLGLLASDTPKGKVSLRFPAHALEILFPRLYPQT
jgi:Fic family protein